jgi:hypothetical protein
MEGKGEWGMGKSKVVGVARPLDVSRKSKVESRKSKVGSRRDAIYRLITEQERTFTLNERTLIADN